MKPQKSFTIAEIKEKMGHYCAYQDRCHYDVEKKLDDFFLIPEAKDEILLYLMRENFLNEERFVESFVRGKFNQKKWGRIKITNELKKRNINQRMIDHALKQIDAEDYYFSAEKLIQKKLKTIRESNEYLKKGKVLRFMLQKGYEYNLCKEIYDNLLSNKEIG